MNVQLNPEAIQFVEGLVAAGQFKSVEEAVAEEADWGAVQANVEGRVTSTYYSATLGRGIAMGLIKHGPDRMGEVIDFPRVDGTIVQAKIVDMVFFDKEGAKQNV